VISVCFVRTGCGKSQTSRKIARILIDKSKKAAAIRHPMLYSDLVKQRFQRFLQLEDLDNHDFTIKETRRA
jgi:predicted GTPase